MAKKQMLFKTKGMNRDLSVSSFNPEFAFENMNLRLSTNEGNTLLSWVNEKGTKKIIEAPVTESQDTVEESQVILDGKAIGTAVVNHKLVVFTTESIGETTGDDHIYVLKYSDKEKEDMLVEDHYEGNLNFSTNNPLETLVSVEADHIEKVYWVDGRNQPRLINIKDFEDINAKVPESGVDTQFDFVPAFDTSNATVTANTGSSGTFEPGVIQYCYTYYNKYGQQTNIVWLSPLYYLAHSDRGASPEEKVTSSFRIEIKNADVHFDYVRLYSIHRTSLNAEPIVKLLDDLSISDATDVTTSGTTVKVLTYTDSGTTGAIMDPYELLYVGGKEIIAQTFADKDDTLFVGNFEEKGGLLKTYTLPTSITFERRAVEGLVPEASGVYSYKNQLDKPQDAITTFKGGETYRFGFQLQKKTGEWSEPVFIKDETNTLYPSVSDGSVNLVQAKATLTSQNLISITDNISDYMNIRPLIVYPTISDRTVLCQGVLNPTVFNVKDRPDNSPYAQASWYFRPIESNMEYDGESVYQPPVGPLAEDFYASITIGDTDEPLNGQGGNTPGGGGGGSDPVDPNEVPTDTPTTDGPSSENPGDTNPTNPETAGARGMGNDTEDSDSTTTDTTTDTPGSTPTDPGNTPSGDTPTEEYDRFTSILIARVDEKEIATILSRRELTYVRRNRNLSDTEEIRETVFPFWGAIRLSLLKELNNTWTGKPLFAFLSGDNASWPVPREDMMGTIGESLQYLHLEEVRVIEESYGIKNLTVSRSGLLCYESAIVSDDEPSGTYTFTFDDHINHYTVVFNEVKRFSDVTTDPNAAPKKGSKLEYRHNHTLFTEDMAYDIAANRGQGDPEEGVYLDKAEQILSRVEIQGSVRKYKTVWNDNNNQMPTIVDSNTQFFVDQNIVTLNSPDIEFDTEVQTYGTDNLQLKIVGKIPITSGGADFDITTSSAMLEVAHQYDLDVIEGNADTYNRWHELNPNPVFGSGVRTYRVLYDGTGQNTQYRHLVSAFLWNDAYVVANPKKEDGITTDYLTHDFMVFPWQRTGSINNDFRNADEASSKLKVKKESNLLFSSNTNYIDNGGSYDNIGCQLHLTENEFIENLRIKGHNYYPNVDKVLYNSGGYNVHSNRYIKSDVLPAKAVKVNSPISMKYKSTSHAVIGINENRTLSTNSDTGPYLWLGELIKNPDDNSRFGGKTQSAIRSNKWQVAGPTVAIGNGNSGNTELTWNQGDTYYQRYDCLKTYAFTPEDTNQIVEILSFMCETHVNIDGRYDKNRGMIDNTDMSPVNFNKLNPVYSQQNNFFTYRQLDHEEEERLRYPNQMWYSKTKTPGADVDLWTNVTLASTLSLDGDKGELNALRRFNNQLLAFQDTGLSQVLYNENTVLSTQQGVPVEIANSNKVSGKSYISNTVGCSNKWSIVNTPNGLYFMDSNDKGIYVFTGQLQNISVQKGFNSWCKQMIPSGEVKWEPVNFGGTTNPGESTESTEVKNSTFTGFYDRQNQDVLWVNNDTAVAYSERVGAFTSFYDYGGTPWFENLDDTGIWIKNGESGAELWKHQAGDYCRFFGENKPYWMTLVGNPEPLTDKIFTNLEFRACVSEDGTVVPANTAGNAIERFNPLLPFDSLETWNEYQHGIANLQWKNQHGPMLHHLRDEGQTAHLNRKFRIWRCDIPRDNVVIPPLPEGTNDESLQSAYDEFMKKEAEKGIYRYKAHPIDRMRNPWLYLKLLKNAEKDIQEGQEIQEKSLNKTEVHDVVMTFYN